MKLFRLVEWLEILVMEEAHMISYFSFTSSQTRSMNMEFRFKVKYYFSTSKT